MGLWSSGVRSGQAPVLAVLILGLVLGAAGAARGAVVDQDLFKEIEGNLVCTDGCGMALKNCDNATAMRMRSDIRQKLAEGATKEQIYAYMISVYGEEVMASPPPQNPLNIAAWVLPFVGLLGGGALLYAALDKWVFYSGHTGPGEKEPGPEVDEAELAGYDQILDKEMKKYL